MPRLSVSDRLDLVVRIMRDRPGITTAALAADLGVSERSVARDMRRLRTRGVPVQGERGRGGGVHLPARWGLGQVAFATDEALAALLALALAERLQMPMFAGALMRGRRKLLAAFPSRERAQLSPLRDRILIGRPASRTVADGYAEPLPPVALALQVAFVRAHVVRVRYRKADGDETQRDVEPHALLINWPAWYVLGTDRWRAATRIFRLDRLTEVRDTGESFHPWSRARAVGEAGIPVDVP